MLKYSNEKLINSNWLLNPQSTRELASSDILLIKLFLKYHSLAVMHMNCCRGVRSKLQFKFDFLIIKTNTCTCLSGFHNLLIFDVR